MTRTMYDSVTVSALPTDGDLYLGYVDGIRTHDNYNEVRARFPHATIVKCTVTGGTLDAQFGDIENGDMSPASGAAWAKRKVDAGQHPTLYMSLSVWPSVQLEVAKLGITGKVSYVVACYDNKPVIPAGAVGKQFIDHGPHGENYDISVIADYWPGVDPTPAPRPATHPLPRWYRLPLRQGIRGWRVYALKRRLAKLGYLRGTWLAWSSVFDAATEAAVRTFQRDHHLAVDGVVGPNTARALRAG